MHLITRFALSGLLAMGLAGGAALAQDAQAPAASTPPMHHMASPDQQLAHMTKMLNLSADQQAQIKPILADRDQQLQALHADTSMSKQDKWAKAKGISQDSDGKINAILNDDQKQKYAAWKAEQKEKMREHMENKGAGAAAPTPQQ